MSCGVEETKEALRLANRALPAVNGQFPIAAPTTKGQAHGRIPEGGILTVEVGPLGTGSVAISLRIWSELQQRWIIPGSSADDSAKTFASANLPAYDYFKGPADALYFLFADTANVLGFDNGVEARV